MPYDPMMTYNWCQKMVLQLVGLEVKTIKGVPKFLAARHMI